MSEIENKVVVITGASSGIGEATAILLAERGAKVVLGARSLDRLEILANKITESGGSAVCRSTNVKRRDDLANLVALATERHGQLDVLINNAGVAPISLLEELRVEDWEEMIDVNLKGVLYGLAAALPVFRKQGSDTSSMLSLQQGFKSNRTWRYTPAVRMLCAPSARLCVRKPSTVCA